MECIFCNIIERKEKAEILFENDKVISFLDIRPVNYGHALVIPKKHYNNFLEVPANELEDITIATQMLAATVRKALNADGFNIVINNGTAAGQTVFHFHFHIIPRIDNDFHYKPDLKTYANDSMKQFADKIRSEINKK